MKACRFCCNNKDQALTAFENLPFFISPIIESAEHVLTECPGYHSERLKLSDNLKSLLMLKEYGLIMSSHHANEFGKFLTECFRARNPKNSVKSVNPKTSKPGQPLTADIPQDNAIIHIS